MYKITHYEKVNVADEQVISAGKMEGLYVAFSETAIITYSSTDRYYDGTYKVLKWRTGEDGFIVYTATLNGHAKELYLDKSSLLFALKNPGENEIYLFHLETLK